MTKAVRLPRSLDNAALWDQLLQKYKAFRLLALELSPEALGASIVREFTFTPEQWASRLTNTEAVTIVLVSDEEYVDDTTLALTSPWRATLTLFGPTELKTAARTYEQSMHLLPDTVDFGPPAPGVDSMYIFNAMWVHPEHRRKGYAKMIIEYAKKLAVEMEGGKKVTLALLVARDNEAAMISYAKVGFELVHTYYLYHDRGRGRETIEAAVMRTDVEP